MADKGRPAAGKAASKKSLKPAIPAAAGPRQKVRSKPPPRQSAPDDFPVVGLGVSAGGLEAFSGFLSKISGNPGMAFILVQHLDPSHTSNMVELLRRYTSLPVLEAANGMRLEPNHVYMIPPNRTLTIVNRMLNLAAQTERAGISHNIDLFFRSLATDLKDRAIAVVLSGTGSDGSLGAKAVKAELGLVVVQDPETAKYDGMPRSAISAGVADFILPVEQMPARLIEYARQSYGKSARQHGLEPGGKTPASLQKIFAIIHTRTKQDFSQYKLSTLNRRIERRMNLNKVDRIDDYVRLLHQNPSEVRALVKDFLISVTSFFRDPEAYDALRARLGELIARKKEGEESGPGCSDAPPAKRPTPSPSSSTNW